MVRIGGLLFGILPAAGGVKQALAAAGICLPRVARGRVGVLLWCGGGGWCVNEVCGWVGDVCLHV
jgi:hypothetical protein